MMTHYGNLLTVVITTAVTALLFTAAFADTAMFEVQRSESDGTGPSEVVTRGDRCYVGGLTFMSYN